MSKLVDASGAPVQTPPVQAQLNRAVEERAQADRVRNEILSMVDARLAWIVEMLRLRCEIELAAEVRRTAATKFENGKAHTRLLRSFMQRIQRLDEIGVEDGKDESKATQSASQGRNDGGHGDGARERTNERPRGESPRIRIAGHGPLGGVDER